MATDEKISIREYASSLRISDKAVRNAIEDGRIKKGVSYKTGIRGGLPVTIPEINKAIADQEFGYKYKTDRVLPGQKKENKTSHDGAEDEEPEDVIFDGEPNDKMATSEAIRQREIVGLKLDRIKLQELEGSLVKKVEVDKALFVLGSELRKALLNIPARIIADIRSAANDVEAQSIMVVEITNTLNQFANLEEVKL
jgi:hypothetical protein